MAPPQCGASALCPMPLMPGSCGDTKTFPSRGASHTASPDPEPVQCGALVCKALNPTFLARKPIGPSLRLCWVLTLRRASQPEPRAADPLRAGTNAGEERGAHRAGALRDGDLVLLAAAAAVQGLQGALRVLRCARPAKSAAFDGARPSVIGRPISCALLLGARRAYGAVCQGLCRCFAPNPDG